MAERLATSESATAGAGASGEEADRLLGDERRRGPLRWIASIWGIGGVVALLLFAVVRLTPIAIDSFGTGLTWIHWLGYAASLAFFGYSEWYRAFHRQFSPRVVARGLALAERPVPLHLLLAPAFCMGFFHATRKRVAISWGVTLGIVGLVVAVGRIAQPWRGIVDLGVATALVGGIGSIFVYWSRARAGEELPVPADLPSLDR